MGLFGWFGSLSEITILLTSYRVAILLTTGIYVRTGRDIYATRKRLQSMTNPQPDPIHISGDHFQTLKTTEVSVTSESIEANTSGHIDLPKVGSSVQNPRSESTADKNNYSVTVSSSQPNHQNETRNSYTEKSFPGQGERKLSISNVPNSAHQPNSNRTNLNPTRRHVAMEANNTVWSYTKVAVLFFIAMMVTWMPSSANRVYSVVHPGEISLDLEYASAFVLPLQGFWNALIYTTTSLPACRQFWAQIRDRRSIGGSGLKQIAGVFSNSKGGQGQQNRKQYIETESMTELATRPDTKGSLC